MRAGVQQRAVCRGGGAVPERQHGVLGRLHSLGGAARPGCAAQRHALPLPVPAGALTPRRHAGGDAARCSAQQWRCRPRLTWRPVPGPVPAPLVLERLVGAVDRADSAMEEERQRRQAQDQTRQLREQQDQEYMEALARDRERVRARRCRGCIAGLNLRARCRSSSGSARRSRRHRRGARLRRKSAVRARSSVCALRRRHCSRVCSRAASCV